MPLYMHTLDGEPATYCKRYGIYRGTRIKLATSLRQVRREKKATELLDLKNGESPEFHYGYVTVRVPAPTRRQRG